MQAEARTARRVDDSSSDDDSDEIAVLEAPDVKDPPLPRRSPRVRPSRRAALPVPARGPRGQRAGQASPYFGAGSVVELDERLRGAPERLPPTIGGPLPVARLNRSRRGGQNGSVAIPFNARKDGRMPLTRPHAAVPDSVVDLTSLVPAAKGYAAHDQREEAGQQLHRGLAGALAAAPGSPRGEAGVIVAETPEKH